MPVQQHNDFNEFKTDIRNLTQAVMNLTINVAAQTSALSSFKDMYELEIRTIHKELLRLAEIDNKVREHDLYIAETEGKISTMTNIIRAGWLVVGANIVGFVGYLIKQFVQNGGANG